MTTQRPTGLPLSRPLLRLLALACGALALTIYGMHLSRLTAQGLTSGTGLAFGDDVINFWSAPRLALMGQAEVVYDLLRYHAFQEAVLGGDIHLYRYSYPPSAVLLTLPLGLLPYLGGWAAWMLGGWLVFAWTVRRAWPDTAAGWGDILLYALAVPAVLMNAVTGQNGPWLAAVLGGGLMLRRARPVAGGMLLGLLSVKPQLAVFVPLALLVVRDWRGLAGFAATAGLLLAGSVAVFGWDLWPAYARHARFLQQTDLEGGEGVWHLMGSIFVAVRHLPAGTTAAYAAQAVAALLAGTALVRAWRSASPQPVKDAALVLCALYATPYLQVYDLVVVTLVPLWLRPVVRDRPREARLLTVTGLLLLVAPVVSFATARGLGLITAPVLHLPILALTLALTRRAAAAP